jgi:hypothetical protein
VAGAFQRLGGDPTVDSATRGGLAGSLLAAVGDVAWGVITYLVVPV